MKRLILDRGFLDGKSIFICKENYGIDILIPIRRNMNINEDAMVLFRQPETDWVCCKEPVAEVKEPVRSRPKAIEKREKSDRKNSKKLGGKSQPRRQRRSLSRGKRQSSASF